MQAWGFRRKMKKKKPEKQQPFPEHSRGMENQEGVSALLALSYGEKRSWTETGWLESFCFKFMLCCISVNKSATEKKHGINLKDWCNYSNVRKAWAN